MSVPSTETWTFFVTWTCFLTEVELWLEQDFSTRTGDTSSATRWAQWARWARVTALQAHREAAGAVGVRGGSVRGREGGRHHAMLSASMPSYPPISIHPHLPAHRPPPMGWLCLPVCLWTNQSDHRMRTQKKKRDSGCFDLSLCSPTFPIMPLVSLQHVKALNTFTSSQMIRFNLSD